MQHLLNYRAKRSIAWTMLLAWLFAISSGVANACLMQQRATHGHAAHTSNPNRPVEVSAGHLGTIAEHGNVPAFSEAACQKVCDDHSRSLLTQPIGAAADDPGIAPLIASVWNAALPQKRVGSRMANRQPPTSWPPLRVRYVRLAL